MSKVKGQAASYAPDLGVPTRFSVATPSSILARAAAHLSSSVSAQALVFALAATAPMIITTTGAQAGACAETFAGSGIFVCSGPVAGGDVTQNLAPPAAGALDVSTDPGFGITAAAGDALNLSNVAGDTDITFTDNNSSTITGQFEGIDVRNYGTGVTSITTSGAVSGSRNGILAGTGYNNAGTALTINTQGTVTGGALGAGITAQNGSLGANNATTTTINAQNTVTGGRYGMQIVHGGSGAFSITTQAVTGTAGYGIQANNLSGTPTTIYAQGAVIAGSYDGIWAQIQGAGVRSLSITSQAVTAARRGIYASSPTLTLDAQDTVIGGSIGIDARSSGVSSITTQAVTGNGGVGILSSSSGTMTIDAQGATSGTTYGIDARHTGTGALTINTVAVTGTANRGINASSTNAASTNLSVTSTGTVTGGTDGINANHAGTGTLNINAAAVTGTAASGIYAKNTAAATGDISVSSSGPVIGQTAGIDARNNGAGAISITATGDVTATGTAVGNSAIVAGAYVGTSTAMTINTQGTVTGGSSGDGINATSGYLGPNVATTMTINAQGAVTGGRTGIVAQHFGYEALSITTQAVTGTTGHGISTNSFFGASTTINAQGTVTGGTDGIAVVTQGGAPSTMSITTQAVTGARRGIVADHDSVGGLLFTLDTQGTVTGGTDGIFAASRDALLSITTQAVAGTTGRGILAWAGTSGLTITVSGAVTGGTDGIGVRSAGNNIINVAAGASVTGGANAIDTTIGAFGSADTVNNYGAVNAGIVLGDGTNMINNKTGATITGNLTTGTGNDTFANDGTFNGNANLGDGTNVVTNTSHTSFTGDLTTGAGNDTTTNTGTWTGNVNLGDGTNVFNIGVGGILTGDLTTGIGNDTFANNGTFTGNANLGDGMNVVTNTSHTSFTGDLTTGAGNDTTTNTGTWTGNVDLGGGTNAFNNGAGGILTGNLTTGTGNDTFANDGTFTGNANLGDGTNVVTNTSHNSFTGDLTTGAGNDTVTNTGTWTGNVNLGGGTNAFNNRAGGILTGILTTGTGNDTFANDGTFTGNANLGDGMNVVTNTSHNSFTGDLTTGTGNDTVTNTGTWTGNVNLGGGVNAFNNSVGGIFNTLANVNVGAGNALTNAGKVSPGDSGTVQTTAVTGNLVQTATGSFAVDIDDTAATPDLLNVSGTANLAGTVFVKLQNVSTGQGAVTILSATGGTTDNGLTVTRGLALIQSLTYPNANDVVLNYSADLTPASLTTSLTPNQTAVGTNLNSILAAGSGNMAAIIGDLLGITDVATYLAALDRLHGEHYLTQAGLLRGSNHFFVENLLSCPSTLEGAAVEMADDKCLWARVDGRDVDIERSSNNIGGGEISWGFSGGYEAPIREDIRVGASFSIETSDIDGNNGASSDGVRFTAGAKVEKVFGALEASVGLYGGVASYDTTRVIGLGGAGVATSDHDIGFGSLVGRVSHTFETGNLRIVPMLDVAATYISYGGINETGAGAANLIIASSDEWVFSATPAIGIMGNIAETETYKINASLKGGVSLYSNSSISFSSRFAGAPAGTPSFTTKSGVDDVVGNLSGAIEFQFASNASLRFGYEGRIGNNTQSHGGFARAVLPF